jgi:hypothetical protein
MELGCLVSPESNINSQEVWQDINKLPVTAGIQQWQILEFSLLIL